MLDNFQDALRRTHEIDFNIYYRSFLFRKKKTVHFRFQEATVYEHLELWIIYKTKTDFIEDFVKKYGRINCKKVKEKYMVYIMYQWEKLWDAINELYFQGLYKEPENNKTDGNQWYLASYLCAFSKEAKTDPLTIAKNYTFKQLEYFSGGIEWNMNKLTKKGERKNRLKEIKSRRKENVDYDSILQSIRSKNG